MDLADFEAVSAHIVQFGRTLVIVPRASSQCTGHAAPESNAVRGTCREDGIGPEPPPANLAARRVDVWGDKVYELEHMHLLRRSRRVGLSLTVGEVALIAAGIGLASPLIAYSTTARLDRERWIRQQRSEVYIEMIAIYGRMARKASHQEEQYKPPAPEEWRLLQARAEVFTSDRVFAFRDRYLDAWNLFIGVFDADSDPDGSSTTAPKQVIDERALAVGQLYDDLCAAIRKELRARSLVRRP